jgi:carboxyl-terminal processing protease
MNTSTKLILALSCFTAGVLTVRLVMAVNGTGGSLLGVGGGGESWAKVGAVRDIIKERYVDEVSEAQLRDGAIRGMVESLNDPYSVYVTAEEAAEFNKDLTGEYVGIGAEVNTRSGWLTIANPMEDSPALRAGLLPEDRVLRINGTSTKDLPVEKCVELLVGQPGTSVTLDILRGTREFSVQIERAKIRSRAVKGVVRVGTEGAWNYMVDPGAGIAYVRITQFTPSVATEFVAALKAMGAGESSRVRGLVLDLRFNGGGVLETAEQIADLFLKDGVIVSTRGRAHAGRVSRAQERGTLPDLPLLLLVNSESASASEVLAGALQDNKRAVVLGTRTFGKGSVQSLMTLGDGGSELKLTEQAYYLPSDRSIQRKDDSTTWGVDPDPGMYVPLAREGLLDVLRVRRKLELLGQPTTLSETSDALDKAIASELAQPRWDDGDWILSVLRDPQLEAGVRAMRARLETGAWQTPGSDERAQEGGTPASSEQVREIASADELVRLRQVEERLLRELARTGRRREALEAGEGVRTLAESRNDRDLWSDAISVEGGTLVVRDRDGKVVTTLRITGDDLERWLLDADVKPEASDSAGKDITGVDSAGVDSPGKGTP